MAEFKTPIKTKPNSEDALISVPASPFLKKIGYGTGVLVYEMKRSPLPNKLQSPWAIKKISKTFTNPVYKTRLMAEADTLRNLNHPNVVGFRALLHNADGDACLAMEECDSCLGNLIEDRAEKEAGPFPVNQIAKCGADISKALTYLHNVALIMHCDIKSYNVLVKGDFINCKLCDFGVCLPVDKNGDLDKAKAGNNTQYVGTPLWSAPEVLGDTDRITVKADVYSFGLTLWEMLGLMPPVDGDYADEDDVDSDDSIDRIYVPSETRKRPSVPDTVTGNEYNLVLEIFYLCTETDLTLRPAASHLELMFDDFIKTILN